MDIISILVTIFIVLAWTLFLFVIISIPIWLWFRRKLKKVKKNIPIKLQEDIINERKEKKRTIKDKYRRGQTSRGEPIIEARDSKGRNQEKIKPERIQVSTTKPISSVKRKPKQDWPEFK